MFKELAPTLSKVHQNIEEKGIWKKSMHVHNNPKQARNRRLFPQSDRVSKDNIIKPSKPKQKPPLTWLIAKLKTFRQRAKTSPGCLFLPTSIWCCSKVSTQEN
jgi:hypothetical protein